MTPDPQDAQIEDGDWSPSTFREWEESVRFVMDKAEAGWLPEDEDYELE
jgi:hypothetical protein